MLVDSPRDSASDRHKLLYQIFTDSPFFSNYVIKQEVPVKELVVAYPISSHRVDWFIQDLGIVIEVMGEQHNKLTRWGNISKELALTNLLNVRSRDAMKRAALEEEGYTYVEIWYDEDLSEELLIGKIAKTIKDFRVKGAAKEHIVERQVTKARDHVTRALRGISGDRER